MIHKVTLKHCNNSDQQVRLQHSLEAVEEENDYIKHAFKEDGDISALFISTHPIKKAFIDSSARTLQIDISFDFKSSKYKLCGLCYRNPMTNKSEFCALAFLSDETAKTLKIEFEAFKKMYKIFPGHERS